MLRTLFRGVQAKRDHWGESSPGTHLDHIAEHVLRFVLRAVAVAVRDGVDRDSLDDGGTGGVPGRRVLLVAGVL